MTNVVNLFDNNISVKEAIEGAKDLDLTEVLIIGTDSTGAIRTRSSRMDRKSALWLIEIAKLWVIVD